MKKQELEKNSYREFKISLLGFVLAFGGFFLTYFTDHNAGMFFFFFGFLIAAIGMAIHYKNFYKELKTDPKELYERSKQPWEKDE